jgi:hypothetical protein
MRRRNSLRRAFVLAAGLLTACKGASYWSGRVRADPLYQRAEKVRDAASCANLVPMEFGQTVPVPVRDDGGRFKVLFYPVVSSPGKAEALSPLYEGLFARDAADSRCARLGAGAPASRGPAVRPGLSQSDYYRAEARLYEALDKTAALYAKGAPLADADKKALADFADAFQVIAEPGLAPDYYRVNPDFWEWLRREAGRSIPKA